MSKKFFEKSTHLFRPYCMLDLDSAAKLPSISALFKTKKSRRTFSKELPRYNTNMKQGKRRGLIIAIFAPLLFCIDFFTKGWIDTHLHQIGFSTPFYPYGGIGVFHNILGIDFSINHVSNLGGAWGIFSSYPKTLLAIRIVIILSLAVYALLINKILKRDVPFMLVLVGAGANIIDFFRFGSVVDMFHFMLGSYSFPVFNVADMLIFFGVSTLLVQSLIEKRKRKSKNAPQHT